jgi:NAD(P)-dependent dehydrogenase (short-subunit alcohol dehydrogenase family)
MKSFTNKVVWVTGASSGIGLAFVEQLVLANAKI